MTSLRHHLVRHRWLAAAVVGLALLVRIVVPAGYMPMVAGGAITIELCSGTGPMTMAMPAMAAMPAMPAMAAMAGHPDKPDGHGKTGEHGADLPCGFAGLAAPSLAGADPIVLAIAVAFIVATALRAVAPRPVGLRRFLRPPLRGPPITA